MLCSIKKRNGLIVDFCIDKIEKAIMKALQSTDSDVSVASVLAKKVKTIAEALFDKKTPSVEDVQDITEQILINEGFGKTAKAFILYRNQHARLRNERHLIDNYIDLVDNYIGLNDWKINENSNMGYSLQGLNNYISAHVSSNYWLHKVYDEEIANEHLTGRIHIHDLGLLGSYCSGWDLFDLLQIGLRGVEGKIESDPPKHLRSALGQIVNFFYTLQGECYSADTKVLTQTGWKYFYETTDDDRFCTLNLDTRKIEYQKRLEYFEKEFNGQLIHFHNNKFDQLVTENHKMIVYNYYNKKLSFKLAKDIKISNSIPKNGFWENSNVEYFYLPEIITRNVIQPKIKINMNVWLKFLGIYISEGDCYKRTGLDKRRNQPRIEYVVRLIQKKHTELFESILNELGFHFCKAKIRCGGISYTISNKQLYMYVEQFGISEDRFIPEEIKNLNDNQLLILYNHLYWGDGLLDTSNGNEEYYTKSLKLAEDVQEIVLKIGKTANIRKKKKDRFFWYVVAVQNTRFFKITKIDKIDYNGKVYCVSVPNQTLFVSRNGKASWGGNCAGAQAFSNFDTLIAPFIRYDNLTQREVKQHMQEFIFNVNVPTRVGFQCVSGDTEILTCGGWKNYNKVSLGDKIKTFNLEKQCIEEQIVNHIHISHFSGEMYSLKSDKTDQLISPKHRVVFFENDKFYKLPIEECLQKEVLQIPVRCEESTLYDFTDVEISKIQYNGIIWCPNTINETIIARRNGKIFITGNTPFTNITMDLQTPGYYRDMPVIIGGQPQKETYKEFQKEMDMLNDAFCEVMMEGDAKGRIFTFPIPTYNLTKEFDWDNPNLKGLWKMTSKYGTPYFANFINSDMSVDDSRSMCCRLRLDNRELRKRGGGLFASNPMTGSIGVVTINLPKLAYETKEKTAFFDSVYNSLLIARKSLSIKRKLLERYTENGLYPYARFYLSKIKNSKRNQYWSNHFNTIGVIGMNEACLNLLNQTIATSEGKQFAIETLEFIREKLTEFQEQDDMMYNLEATPGEGTSYRLAQMDKRQYPDIKTSGITEPYYTNSTQLPVNQTTDIFDALQHQDEIQCLYTGGCVEAGNYVLTNKGKIKIEELYSRFQNQESFNVISYNKETGKSEWDSVLNTYCLNVKKNNKIRIVGERGLDITTTDWHPFFVLEPNVYDNRCPICTLSFNSYKSVSSHFHHNIKCHEEYKKLPKYRVVEKRADELKENDWILQSSCNLLSDEPSDIDNELMWLIGFYIGDGWISEYIDNRGGNNIKKYSVLFSKENIKKLNKCQDILFKHFGAECNAIIKDKRGKGRSICTSKTSVSDFFFSLGFKTGKKAYTVDIPQKVKEKINKENFYYLLSGLIASDSYICKKQNDLEYYTVSKNLAFSIVEICTLAGILVGCTDKTPIRENESILYRIRIPSYELNKIKKDLQLIKDYDFTNGVKGKFEKRLPVVRVKSVSKVELKNLHFYDLTTEKNHNYLCGKNTYVFIHNTVIHGFIGEQIHDPEVCKELVKKIANTFKLPYFTVTPTFSICPVHGYIAGEHHNCPVITKMRQETGGVPS